MRTLSFTSTALLYFFCQLVWADGTAIAPGADNDNAWSRIEFHFDQKYFNINNNQDMVIQPDFQSLNSLGLDNQYEQLDARVLFPLSGSKYKLGLGLNLRHIQGNTNRNINGTTYKSRYSDTIPALYADAMLNLPLKGFSAGFEGSHDPLSEFIDYRAKLNYEWQNSVGVQGGWKHQQFSFDLDDESQTRVTTEGPFIDFYWRF